MFKNYFKIAVRNIFRNKIFSFINIFGLAIGLAISIIILVYVKHELSFDRFHRDADQIYLLGIHQFRKDVKTTSSITAPPMGPDLTVEIPEIEKCVRMSTVQPGSFGIDEKQIETSRLLYVDSTFFDIFSFNLIQGDKHNLLNNPNTVVLTKSLAKKIFKDENPLGKSLTFNGNMELTVTGVLDDPPANTMLQFEALVSLYTRVNMGGVFDSWDGNFSFYTYLKLVDNGDLNKINTKAQSIFDRKVNEKLASAGWRLEPVFEKITDLHLRSDLQYLPKKGSLTNVYIYFIVALFILVIAGINFMNLTTSLSIKRFKEVGLRRVVGATRRKVIMQFLGEAIFISLISMIFALIFIEMYMPVFNRLFNTSLSLYTSSNIYILLGIPLLTVSIGALAGLYPALYTSRYQPVNILKENVSKRPGKLSVLNMLVILQFVISIGLIIATTVISVQINFLLHKDLGFKKENIISLRIPNQNVREKADILRDEFIKLPHVMNASVASDFPGRGLTQNGYTMEGVEKPLMIHALYVDYNYLGTFNLKVVQGREFDPDFKSDEDKYLINETLARQLGWKNPVGKWIQRNGKKHEVLGVVKDFHFNSLHQEIAPLIFTMKPRKSVIIVRMDSQNQQATVKDLQKVYNKVTGDNAFSYFFINDIFENIYRSDINFKELVNSFTILAIIIACLGLFGLTAFSSEQRIKEIAVRKALGASVTKINIWVISKFMKLVLIATLISWPITFYLMSEWLQNYAYRINLSVIYFIVPSLLAMFIAVLTLVYHAVRAANTNPADVLKYE